MENTKNELEKELDSLEIAIDVLRQRQEEILFLLRYEENTK